MVFLLILICIKQMGDVAQLLGRRLEGFDLFPQFSLLGLFLAQHLMNVSHERLLKATLRWGAKSVNERALSAGYARNTLCSKISIQPFEP
jgi:hypothetical protein